VHQLAQIGVGKQSWSRMQRLQVARDTRERLRIQNLRKYTDSARLQPREIALTFIAHSFLPNKTVLTVEVVTSAYEGFFFFALRSWMSSAKKKRLSTESIASSI
jgi:hypothetical protein